MNKSASLGLLLILSGSLGIFNVAPVMGKAQIQVLVDAATSGSGTAGTGTLTIVTVYQVQFNPTPTLQQGAGAFNGTLSLAGHVVGIFTMKTAIFSATSCTLSGVIVLGSFTGQPVTETVFGNCLPSNTATVVVVFLIGSNVPTGPIWLGKGTAQISGLEQEFD